MSLTVWWLLCAAVVLDAAFLGCGRIATRNPPTGPPAYSGPMNQLLLKDYDPVPSLTVTEHHPVAARFPAVDLHAHSPVRTPQAVADLVRTMDEAGVSTVAIMTGAVGQEFDQMAALYLPLYPNRFVLFCGVLTRDEDQRAPDYSARAVAELERCYRSGGRGVGEVVDKGRGLDANTYVDVAALKPPKDRLHLDDPRLDQFWLKCAELHLPVVVHAADHPSAWQPADRHQERPPVFQVYNQYGIEVLSHAEIIRRFLAVVGRHANTTFIAAHLGNLGHDLAQLARALDTYPNLAVDLSARDYEIGRQPFTAQEFFARYFDRIVFGSDANYDGRPKPMLDLWQSQWRILETHDEFIKGPSWWRLYGIALPDRVLEAVYRGNANRLLSGAGHTTFAPSAPSSAASAGIPN